MNKLIGRDISLVSRDCPVCRGGGAGWDGWNDTCQRCDGTGLVFVCPTCDNRDVEAESRCDSIAGTQRFLISCPCGVETTIVTNAFGTIASVDEVREGKMYGTPSAWMPAPAVCPNYTDDRDEAAWEIQAKTIEAPVCPRHQLTKIPGRFYGPEFPDWVCPECRSKKAFDAERLENFRANAQRVTSSILQRCAEPVPDPVGLERIEAPDTAEVSPDILARFRNLRKL